MSRFASRRRALILFPLDGAGIGGSRSSAATGLIDRLTALLYMILLAVSAEILLRSL